MSLPKEPRQKMINMMYLVLTALLALNVSSEILNAFKTVNNSIIHANAVVDDKNATTFKSFDAKAAKDDTKEKAILWGGKAKAAKKLSDEMSNFIETLKVQLKTESKGENIGTPEEHFSEDNLEASTRLLVEGPQGKELEAKLTEYKKQMLAILPEEKASFEKSLPLDLTVPPGQHGDLTNTDWSAGYFRMTPTIAAVTILSKFQNDVKNSEAQIVDFCHKKIGEVEVHMDQVGVLVGQNSNYLMPGQELEIKAGVGAYSSTSSPTIVINGQGVSPVNGQGVYKTTAAAGAGEHSVPVKITFKDETGKMVTKDETVKYTVGIPSGASIFLEKMNVMYVGVENPLTISAGSAGREKMQASFTLGSLTPAGGDRFIAKPTSVGPAEIRIVVNGKPTAFPIRCKMLPDPQAMVGSKRGGTVSAAEFKVQGGILAKLESEFDVAFKVISYSIGANGGNFGTYKQATNDGPRWSGNAASIISQSGPGTSIFFDQIRVQGPDGKVRELPTLAFQLK